MTSSLVSGLILEEVSAKPLTRPVDVVKEMKNKYGVSISYSCGWLGVEKAKCSTYGDSCLSFNQLRWYFDEALKNNPGSCFELDFEDNKHFKRVFVAFHACIAGFKYCRSLLFLDGTFLKRRYKGVMLAATGKDRNEGFFPIAFVVVDAENKDNWCWFLEHLCGVLRSERVISFISDRHCGIMEGIARFFPNCFHGFCLEHLKRNLRDKLSCENTNLVRETIVSKFSECAYAPTKASFHFKLNELKREGGDIVSVFLRSLPYENWSDAYFERKRYGEMYSNVAESFNSWIRDARHLPITNLVDMIRLQMMNMSVLEKAFLDGRTLNMSLSSDNVFEVHCFPSVMVDLLLRTCSCRKWKINGYPCQHAVAALFRSGKNLNSFVEPFFYIDMYRQAYSFSIGPVPTVEKPVYSIDDAMILPPLSKRPAGRPKKNRISSTGEFKRAIKCSRCETIGRHNKRTCKEPLLNS
ncbi:hypothetical protein ACSBR1_043537 [Camellia fascicularis]